MTLCFVLSSRPGWAIFEPEPGNDRSMESGLPDEARFQNLGSENESSMAKPAYAPIGASAGVVGATGFEPATSSSRTKRATGLRYAPK